MKYAQATTVPEARSRAEIEQVIRKYLGRDAAYSYGSGQGMAAIQFSAHGRHIRFELPLPNRTEAAAKAGRHYKGRQCRTPSQREVDEWLEAEDRRRWRCLLLILKAKFEAVELKLELCESEEDRASVFEQEFLASIVVSDAKGMTTSLYSAIKASESGGRRLLPPLAAAVRGEGRS